MKKTDYERIESQLSPDDKLIRSVMDKAESFSAEPEKAQAFLQEHDVSERPAIKHTSRYAVIAAAAALVLVIGAAAHRRIKSGEQSRSKTRTAKQGRHRFICQRGIVRNRKGKCCPCRDLCAE